MKIKDFLKNCRYCHHVYFKIERPNQQKKVIVMNGQEYEYLEIEDREIYTKEDFDKFINDYGDEEFDDWSFENNEDDAIITFYLK